MTAEPTFTADALLEQLRQRFERLCLQVTAVVNDALPVRSSTTVTDFGVLTESSAAMIRVSSIHRMLNKLKTAGGDRPFRYRQKT